jgi:hypothetical protein
MTAFDTEAQCLIDGGDGKLYLCPRYKRDEGEAYFACVHEYAGGTNFSTPQLPPFLTLVESLEKLHFYRAFIEDGGKPSVASAAAINNSDIAMERN